MTRKLGVRTRLTLGVSAVIVVTCGVLGWLLTRGELLQLDALVAARGQGVADYLARNGETEMLSADRSALRRLGERVIDQQGIAYARFFDRRGTLIAGVEKRGAATPTEVGIREVHASITTLREQGHPGGDKAPGDAAPTPREIARIGTVAVGVSAAGFEAVERAADTRTLTVTAAMALLAVLSAFVLVRALVRPPGEAPRPVERRDEATPMTAGEHHEMRTVASAFTALAESVAALQRRIDAQATALAEKAEPAEPPPLS